MAIYLDNNATTPTGAEVAEAMDACYRAGFANPASSHQEGRNARRKLEACRDKIAISLGASMSGMDADRLLFTSGGTESNNLAILGLAEARSGQIIISSLEHPSVAAAADWLRRRGRKVVRLAADPNGVTLFGDLANQLREPTALVSVMWANNEMGVIQPVDSIARICREAGIPFHVDAVQAVGKIPVRFQDLGASAMSFNAHKLHGPPGVGGLLLSHKTTPEPWLHGGFQQMGIRPGTESVALAVGMQVALEAALDHRRVERMREMRDLLEREILARVGEAVVIGTGAARVPHTACIAFPGVDRQGLLMALDMAGVACSAGSACASGSSEPSPTLLAMGLPDEWVESALRFSLSFLNTEHEMREAAVRIAAAVGSGRQLTQ